MTLASKFMALPARERNALAAGAFVALALAAYGWLWLPLAADTAKLRDSVPQLRAQSARFETDAQEAKRLLAMPRPATGAQASPQAGGDTLASDVEQSVLGAGLKDRLRVQPLDGGRVQLASEGIGFNEWISLLSSLQQLRGAHVSSARIEPAPGSTLVRAQAVLSRAGGKS